MLAARRVLDATAWNPDSRAPRAAKTFSSISSNSRPTTLSASTPETTCNSAAAGSVLRARGSTYPYQMHGSLGASCALADRQAGWCHAGMVCHPIGLVPVRSIVATLLGLLLDSVRVICITAAVRDGYGLNGADAVSFDAAMLSQAAGRPVRLQFSRQDEMMWENFGSACVIEHRAGMTPDGGILAWDRENWVASGLGNRPGYDQPGNVISGMLAGYPPEPFKPGPAKPPAGELSNGSNTVPSYFAGCIAGKCGGGGTIRSERVLTHTVRSPFFTGPLRSPLRIQNTFANECFMDELCAHAKADPVTFRLQHLRDSRVIGVLNAAARAAGWAPRPFPTAAVPQKGLVSGRGIACVAYEGENGYAALVAEVTVDLESGLVHPGLFCGGL